MTPKQVEVAYSALGHDERRVAVAVIERLRMGRERYGELQLAVDTRDWRQEAAEEALDLAVYQAIRCIRAAADIKPQPCPRCTENDAVSEAPIAQGTQPGVEPVGIGGGGEAL